MASTAKLESKLGQQPQEVLKCPRCDSSNTKFCYYNNYSLSQPRHFCKSCKRYWTRGGTLRNVPVGGRCRKNKHFKRPPYPSFSSSSATSNTYSYNTHQIDTYSDGDLPFPSFDSIISSGYYDFLQRGQLGVLGLGSPSASTPAMDSFLASSFQQQSFINGGHTGVKGEAADTMKQVKLEGGQMELLGSATDPSVMYCVNAWRGGLSNINSSVTSLI